MGIYYLRDLIADTIIEDAIWDNGRQLPNKIDIEIDPAVVCGTDVSSPVTREAASNLMSRYRQEYIDALADERFGLPSRMEQIYSQSGFLERASHAEATRLKNEFQDVSQMYADLHKKLESSLSTSPNGLVLLTLELLD